MPVIERYDPTPAQRAAVEALCAELSDPERCVTRKVTAIHQAGNLVRVVHMQGTSVEDILIDPAGERVAWEPSVIAPYGVTITGKPLGIGAMLRA